MGTLDVIVTAVGMGGLGLLGYALYSMVRWRDAAIKRKGVRATAMIVDCGIARVSPVLPSLQSHSHYIVYEFTDDNGIKWNKKTLIRWDHRLANADAGTRIFVYYPSQHPDKSIIA